MPVPLPPRGKESRERPSQAETQLVADAITWAVRGPDGLTGTQRMLVLALLEAMTDHPVEIDEGIRTDASTLAEGFRDRDRAYRTRIVQLALLCALVLRPLPPEVVDRVAALASELWVDERMIRVAQEFAAGSLGLAAVDFQRNGYTQHWDPASRGELHASRELHDAWESAVDDPELAARWLALAELPLDSLGHARVAAVPDAGLRGPGPSRLGSAVAGPARLGARAGRLRHHRRERARDVRLRRPGQRRHVAVSRCWPWSCRCSRPGYLRTGAGLFESDQGHLSHDDRMAVRIADAMRRGALCEDLVTSSTSIDFLALDWFELAPLSLSQARARFQVPPKSAAAIEAGSVGPFQPGGITDFQASSARMAESAGRSDDQP